MTVPNRELWLTPSKSLATHSKFYPTKITVSHHQLRHFISSSEKDLIYYVSCKDVFVLDLATQQNSLIATIPFESRCLAADLGWVCVGGEHNGDCAFIKIQKDEHDRPTCFGHDMNIDLLGGEIVNAMSIHTFLNHGKTPDEPVVLISNNDKTVKIYSLAQRQVLTTLRHPAPINFAALSPDSTILAAVGDSDRVYFYRRHLEEDRDIIDGSSGKYAKYCWQLFAKPVVPIGDPVYDDHGFAVTFSPSGSLCAASSQGGSISIFDMRHLLSSCDPSESSIICSFRSSRPALFGCVRSMTFSPAPWDLLVWAEDHGRIGVADVRQSCVRRQILDLDRQTTEEVKLEDGTPVAFRNITHKERLLQQRLIRLRAMSGLSRRDLDNEIRANVLLNETAQRHNRRDLINYGGFDLDARERSVVEALDTTMEHVEVDTTLDPSEQPRSRVYSIDFSSSSPGWMASSISSDATPQSPGAAGRSVAPRSPRPRRRTSIVLSEPTGSRFLDLNSIHRVRLSASPARMDDDEGPPAETTNTSNSTSGPSSIPQNDPWYVIQSALETARVSDQGNRSSTLLARVEAALEAERRLGIQLERQLADERQLSLLLRRQLDIQQRLLADNPDEFDNLRTAARESNARVAASLERIVQAQLTHEEQYIQSRSRELQSELRVGVEYFRRLQTERERILDGASGDDVNSLDPPNSSSARTSTLPTTNLRSSGQSDSVPNVLTDYSESSRQRLAHVENLQRQVRRAESRVAQAAVDTRALETAMRRGSLGNQLENQSESVRSFLGAAEASSTSVGTWTTERAARSYQIVPQLINRPATANTNVRRGPVTTTADPSPQRLSSNSGREAQRTGRVPDADMRMARILFLSGVTGNRSVDANGNWLPPANGSALERVTGTHGRSAAATGAAGLIELGTTGIGFSPDGQFLYAGSEEGIFEFKVNLRDRMTFPSFEVR
ncbi:hypothetical protein Z517_12373 [Fonsecaea pedrosoi CBS 271.37]|uniref:DUF2415 domain-containing protein n=1 Tax=Fonsecaea pedrosoi CBS 271.37 TaxID=1442368 RepID=A0A0D2G0Z7_9EURO|nr:uncharacterized protein Z517_12373 [Fonsecaea pedrosoi CBS 271.37]KIW74433.1 hypothetical protein Z517_12373 [Fonsecaea pedrosoi CBS 271.37]